MLKQWTSRIFLFFIFLVVLLSIKNEYHMVDEYWYAIHLDQGTGLFHSYHFLSQINAYVMWFLATILGFEVSAYRSLQLASIFFSAIGAVALIDLGRYWKLSWAQAFLFSAPVIFSNGFLRYGTSAYPDAAAFGMGLVAINYFIKVLDGADKDFWVNCFKYFISGIVTAIAGLMHIIVLLLMPGFWLGGVLRLLQLKCQWKHILGYVLCYLLGLGAVLGAMFMYMYYLSDTQPEKVSFFAVAYENTAMSLLKGKIPDWFPTVDNLIQNIKTFGAVFIPGVHSPVLWMDIILDIPRVSAVFLIVALIVQSWRKRASRPEVAVWLFPSIVGVFILFTVMLFTSFYFCRQYAVVSLAAFGPLFLLLGIVPFSDKPKRIPLPMMIIIGAFIFHMIWGIEGYLVIRDHDSRAIRELHGKCDIHRPKPVQFPWAVGEASVQPGCRYDSTQGPSGDKVGYVEMKI